MHSPHHCHTVTRPPRHFLSSCQLHATRIRTSSSDNIIANYFFLSVRPSQPIIAPRKNTRPRVLLYVFSAAFHHHTYIYTYALYHLSYSPRTRPRHVPVRTQALASLSRYRLSQKSSLSVYTLITTILTRGGFSRAPRAASAPYKYLSSAARDIECARV